MEEKLTRKGEQRAEEELESADDSEASSQPGTMKQRELCHRKAPPSLCGAILVVCSFLVCGRKSLAAAPRWGSPG